MANSYLSRTTSSAGNRMIKFDFSAWIKNKFSSVTKGINLL